MNYIDIILILVGLVLIVGALTFGISSQFLFPLFAGMFGASLATNFVVSYFSSPNFVLTAVIYSIITLVVGGVATLVFKLLRMSRHSTLVSRVVGLITAVTSVVLLLLATKNTMPLLTNFLNNDITKSINESLILSYIK